MRNDEAFRILVGAVTTLYAVNQRKVQGLDARSFKAAKERLVQFAAASSGWAIRNPTGDRRWSRGPLHTAGPVKGRTETGDVERVGRRGSGIRRVCPSCGQEAPALFRCGQETKCPGCAGRSIRPSVQNSNDAVVASGTVSVEALEAFSAKTDDRPI